MPTTILLIRPVTAARAGVLLAVLLLAGCGADQQEPATAVYVDVETGQVLRVPAQGDVPREHPDTGRRTLMPGLYCAACDQWYPAPPPEAFAGNPRGFPCPVHQTPMTTEEGQ